METSSKTLGEPEKAVKCTNKILIEIWPLPLALKGNQSLEAGYIWAPYVPMVETPRITMGADPASGMLSRYSTTMIDNRFYATVQLSGE